MDKSNQYEVRVVDSLEVPRWGKVYVRSLTYGEAKAIKGEKDEFRADMLAIVYGIGDENGKRIFDVSDIPSFDSVPLETLSPCVRAVVQHLVNATKRIDDAKKNSDPAETPI